MTAVLRAGALVDQVVYSIERAIIDGELRGGQELRQAELCASLGVSRTPVREALRRLEALGVVVLGANRTAYVRRMARSDVVELYEVRADLEGRAAEHAAERMTPAVIAELEDAQSTLERVSSPLVPGGPSDEAEQAELHARLREPNDRFHRAIHKTSGSPLLGELTELLWNRFPKDYAWRALAQQEDVQSLHFEQHRRIMAALAAGQPGAARAAMRDHVLRSGELLIEYLDRQSYWSAEEAVEPRGPQPGATPTPGVTHA
jgi:DNA-binding GntR family transcriptional regulator